MINRFTIAVLAAVATAIAASPAGARTARHVTFDLHHHRVGGLVLGHATRRGVEQRFGQPLRVDRVDYAPGARQLVYSCGHGCTLVAQVRRGRLRMVFASSDRPRRNRGMRTTAGSYLGLSASAAEKNEGATLEPGCVPQLTVVSGDFLLDVVASNGSRVDMIILADSHDGVDC